MQKIIELLENTENQNILAENKELVNPFEMGYFIHLLTDKYWFRDYIVSYIERYAEEKTTKKLTSAALKNLIYNDYTNINIDSSTAHLPCGIPFLTQDTWF